MTPVTIPPGPGPAREPLADAVENLLRRQDASGRWEGEVAWNTMLLSQYVLTCRMAGNWPLPGGDRGMILRHYQVTQRSDGSWPLHAEAPGSLFVTVLAYVALRVLGLPADDPLPAAARRWMAAQPDGVTVVASWGRMWLAMLGLYEYEGINPLCPETVLLPRWVPLHPDRLYVHTRLIYFGMACLYARRARFDLGSLAAELRAELYGCRYESIDFAGCRGRLAAADVAVPPARVLRLGSNIFHALRAPSSPPAPGGRRPALPGKAQRRTGSIGRPGRVTGQRAARLPGPGRYGCPARGGAAGACPAGRVAMG